jgi:hypothetical protein
MFLIPSCNFYRLYLFIVLNKYIYTSFYNNYEKWIALNFENRCEHYSIGMTIYYSCLYTLSAYVLDNREYIVELRRNSRIWLWCCQQAKRSLSEEMLWML